MPSHYTPKGVPNDLQPPPPPDPTAHVDARFVDGPYRGQSDYHGCPACASRLAKGPPPDVEPIALARAAATHQTVPPPSPGARAEIEAFDRTYHPTEHGARVRLDAVLAIVDAERTRAGEREQALVAEVERLRRRVQPGVIDGDIIVLGGDDEHEHHFSPTSTLTAAQAEVEKLREALEEVRALVAGRRTSEGCERLGALDTRRLYGIVVVAIGEEPPAEDPRGGHRFQP